MLLHASSLFNLSVLGYSAAFILDSLIVQTVYQLYFHPLAFSPSPRRAAISTLWLYSVSKQGRHETFEGLHKKYNTRSLPIAPNKLDLSDSTSYHTMYSQHRTLTKTTDLELRRQRRKALNSFSKSSIQSMQQILYSKVTIFASDYQMRESRCLTVDFITQVAFGKSFGLLTKSGRTTFTAPFLQAFDLVADGPARYFHRLLCTTKNNIDAYKKRRTTEEELDHEVIFDKILDVNDTELLADAIDILAAGLDTTANTLAIALEQLIKTPERFVKLKEKLKEAVLRYAMPVPRRLSCIVPKASAGADSLVVDDNVIPPGVLVDISTYTVHFDEKTWGSDTRALNSERWLTNDAKHLEKYLITFLKGARLGLGINHAYAEATLTLAILARRFSFGRDETMTDSDLEQFDTFTMGVGGSGFRAHVREVSA
ncbi:cytochrome P450 [Macroventuria anomochaeta]|uniref:Cytochrome P450 n=1 Tax=Macroventuria anomochaeta TaxID=301207 RepID=A0ACB6S2V2_9PLEO|nr:cytochrome P450 [Macroventuria anomochaeta]KAF2628596.1 cytochrome P450 [Macroventuria anomochaeta]